MTFAIAFPFQFANTKIFPSMGAPQGMKKNQGQKKYSEIRLHEQRRLKAKYVKKYIGLFTLCIL